MNELIIETKRLILRRFHEQDLKALYHLLKDEQVNTFLPWYPVKNIEETFRFYQKHIVNEPYFLAICLQNDNLPIGYVHMSMDESHDFGYALCQEYWHKGIVTEASQALIEQLKNDGIPYITATHDRNNPRSGGVMYQIGMKYCYSYVEQWQPKNIPVTFRMYQLNLDGHKDRVYQKYWNLYDNHFIEKDL